jgi:hypothetical protein
LKSSNENLNANDSPSKEKTQVNSIAALPIIDIEQLKKAIIVRYIV